MSVILPTRLTEPHKKLHNIISDMGFAVADEVEVGDYILDCYVREVHLGFEYDGPLHDRPKQKKHDKNRDEWLNNEAGIPVFRVNEVQLKDKEQLQLDIVDFIETHMWTIEERRGKYPYL